MKKVVSVLALGMILCMVTIGCVYMIQYNGNGLGRYLCVEIDQSGWKDIGQSNSVQIYTYNLKNPYVVAFTSKKIFLEDGIQSGKITIKDLCKYSQSKEQMRIDNETGTVYLFENYQIIMLDGKCIITPLDIAPDKLSL